MLNPEVRYPELGEGGDYQDGTGLWSEIKEDSNQPQETEQEAQPPLPIIN